MSFETDRRTVLAKGAAVSLAAAVVPAMAQRAAATADPRTRHMATSFVQQTQKWPGLQRNMRPVPDCGEASYRSAGRLQGLKALVTGGDSGIGRAAAIAFAREGAEVAINYLPAEELDARDLALLLHAEGRRLVLLPSDLTDADFCRTLVVQAHRRLGGLDILVNNAAYSAAAPSILDISPEQFDRTMKTNVYAMFHLSRAAVPLMAAGATIINTGSVNSVDPNEDLLDYATSKGAVLIFTKGLAKQLGARGIRVNMVAPGPVWTPVIVAGGVVPDKISDFGQNTPLGRAGQPVEFANLFVVLADPSSSFTTGSVFGANGGTGAL